MILYYIICKKIKNETEQIKIKKKLKKYIFNNSLNNLSVQYVN